jgi:hypothetical protein
MNLRASDLSGASRLIEALPQLRRTTPSGASPQLIRWLAVGLARGRPLEARVISGPTDSRRLARTVRERCQTIGEVQVRGASLCASTALAQLAIPSLKSLRTCASVSAALSLLICRSYSALRPRQLPRRGERRVAVAA